MRIKRFQAQKWATWWRAREAGMTTAEYAVGTIAACAFAAVLLAIVQSGGIESLVTKVVKVALSVSL